MQKQLSSIISVFKTKRIQILTGIWIVALLCTICTSDWELFALNCGVRDLSFLAILKSFLEKACIVSGFFFVFGGRVFAIILVFSIVNGLAKRKPDYPMIVFAGLGIVLTVLPIFIISELVCLGSAVVFAIIFVVYLINSLVKRKPAYSAILTTAVATLLLLLPSILKIENSFAVSSKLPEIPYLSANKMPDFGGTYYYGDGLGFNNQLNLQPDHTCNWSTRGCTGTSQAYSGTYEYEQGYLVLTADHQLNHFVAGKPIELEKVDHPIIKHLIPICWDKRIYLIYPYQMLDFYIAVNEKKEPRNRSFGNFYLREKD